MHHLIKGQKFITKFLIFFSKNNPLKSATGKVFRATSNDKPHAPPLVRSPVNSFKFSPQKVYSSGGTLNALAVTLKKLFPKLTFSVHRLRLRLLGYLILFTPLTLVS